jgi:hypothetical protein
MEFSERTARSPGLLGYDEASVAQAGLLPGRQVEAKAQLVTVRLAELVSARLSDGCRVLRSLLLQFASTGGTVAALTRFVRLRTKICALEGTKGHHAP